MFFYVLINNLERLVLYFCLLKLNTAALAVFRGICPSEERHVSRGNRVKDKELPLVICQGDVTFPTNALGAVLELMVILLLPVGKAWSTSI